jgi:L-asparagine oxygenase
MENISILVLNNHEIDFLKELALKITVIPSKETELFCKQVKDAAYELPEYLKNKFFSFARYGTENGFLLVQGLVVDESCLPNTPATNNEKIGEQTLLSRIQAIFLELMGQLIAYEAEGNGSLFQDVVPVKKMALQQTSTGSEMDLEIHTEQAFSKLRPDILSLACLRGDLSAYTYILPVHCLFDHLTEEEVKMLFEPLWMTGVDLSFQLNGEPFLEGDLRGPLSILSGSKEDPLFVFDQDLFIGTTEESKQMISKIVSIYYQHRIEHNLVSGEILFIDNRRSVHGRSSFLPRYDGYDRFLIRSFATLDYEKSSYARINNGRVIAAKYS